MINNKLLIKVINVITEEQKFLADVYKICGFALMSPFGRFFLILSDIKFDDYNLLLFIHAIVSVALFCFGFIMIQKAYEEISEK